MHLLRATQAVVDLDALHNNVRIVRAAAGDKTDVMAVIKADAYGHGAVAMMGYLREMGVGRFAVASLNEACELLRAWPDGNVLILGHTPDVLLPDAAELGAALTIFSLRQARILSETGRDVRIHIKLDTGMHRLGFMPDEQSLAEVVQIYSLPHIHVEGIYSHLALRDRQSDLEQLARFTAFTRGMEQHGLPLPLRHLCDGLGTCRYPEMRLDMVRPGGALYGYGEFPGLTPVLTLHSTVASLRRVPAGEGLGYDLLDPAPRERLIATLPFGYCDGPPRALSRGVGYVVIRGQKAPYAGLLCMDMCMADVTDIEGVREGDDVVVLGAPSPALSFADAAALLQMNRNEIFGKISRRVPRVYTRDGATVCANDYSL